MSFNVENVDHPCHRCGAKVLDNAPFCSQCGAPQIRVNLGGEAEAPPPVPTTSVPATDRVAWRIALPRTILAALLGSIVTFLLQLLLPPLLILLLVVPFTGAMGVWLYRRGDPALTAGKGFRIGMATGFMLFMLNLLLGLLGYFADRKQFLASLRKAFEQAAASTNDPNAKQMLMNMVDKPEALAMFVAFAALLSLVLLVLFCGAGGAIAGRSGHHS